MRPSFEWLFVDDLLLRSPDLFKLTSPRLSSVILPPSWALMHRVPFILHLVFGGVFVWAGAMKVWNPMVFLDDVRSFALLPDPYAAMLALFLPWLEIYAGLAVMTGALRKGGLLVLNGSLLVFLAAIVIAWVRGTDIRCGCFGGDGDASSNYLELLVRDLALLALGLWLSFSPRRPRVL
jgi:putative oxidoreductase